MKTLENITPACNDLSETEQHTPGPWIAKPTASLGPQFVVYPEAAGPDIAIIYDHGNTEANACLIAAAPELLNALEIAVASLERLACTNSKVASIQGTLSLANSAIAKAKRK